MDHLQNLNSFQNLWKERFLVFENGTPETLPTVKKPPEIIKDAPRTREELNNYLKKDYKETKELFEQKGKVVIDGLKKKYEEAKLKPSQKFYEHFFTIQHPFSLAPLGVSTPNVGRYTFSLMTAERTTKSFVKDKIFQGFTESAAAFLGYKQYKAKKEEIIKDFEKFLEDGKKICAEDLAKNIQKTGMKDRRDLMSA